MLEVDSGCQICLSGSSQIISDIVKSCDRRKLKSSLTWLQYMDEDALYGCRVMVNSTHTIRRKQCAMLSTAGSPC